MAEIMKDALKNLGVAKEGITTALDKSIRATEQVQKNLEKLRQYAVTNGDDKLLGMIEEMSEHQSTFVANRDIWGLRSTVLDGFIAILGRFDKAVDEHINQSLKT